MGGGREMGVKYGRLPEKTGVLTGMDRTDYIYIYIVLYPV